MSKQDFVRNVLKDNKSWNKKENSCSSTDHKRLILLSFEAAKTAIKSISDSNFGIITNFKLSKSKLIAVGDKKIITEANLFTSSIVSTYNKTFGGRGIVNSKLYSSVVFGSWSMSNYTTAKLSINNTIDLNKLVNESIFMLRKDIITKSDHKEIIKITSESCAHDITNRIGKFKSDNKKWYDENSQTLQLNHNLNKLTIG
jgi:hypothetical protein